MNIRTLQYILSGIIFLCICTLLGWYLFLYQKQQTISSVQSGRNLSGEEPQSSPLGSAYTNLVSTLSSVPTPSVTPTTKEKARLWHVTTTPVAGMGFVVKNNMTYLYFVERGTGYVLSAHVNDRTIERLSNTLLPKTYEAFVGAKGDIVLRSIDEGGNSTTLLGRVERSTSSVGTYVGSSLPLNITDVVWKQDGTQLAFVRPTNEGSIVQMVKSDGVFEKTSFTSGIEGWSLSWANSLLAVQKTSRGIPGSLYEIKDGTWNILENAVPGLSVRASQNVRALGVEVAGSPRIIINLGGTLPALSTSFATVADKCTWIREYSEETKSHVPARLACAVPSTLPQGFPDSWYQGLVHTDDTWQIFDTRTGTVSAPQLPPSTPPLDVENPMTDDGGTYLAFIDAQDKSLWLLQLTE